MSIVEQRAGEVTRIYYALNRALTEYGVMQSASMGEKLWEVALLAASSMRAKEKKCESLSENTGAIALPGSRG